jgi:hypothetical protein
MEPEKKDGLTLGQYVELVRSKNLIPPATFKGYLTRLRQIVSEIKGIKSTRNRFGPQGKGRRAWIVKVDSVPLGRSAPTMSGRGNDARSTRPGATSSCVSSTRSRSIQPYGRPAACSANAKYSNIYRLLKREYPLINNSGKEASMAIRRPRAGSLSPREHARRATEHAQFAQHHMRAVLVGTPRADEPRCGAEGASKSDGSPARVAPEECIIRGVGRQIDCTTYTTLDA